MSVKIFEDTIDVAVVGLTNSGKSTFISAMFNKDRIADEEFLFKLRDNNGGLTKVTTFYSLMDCDAPSVSEVIFQKASLIRGIDKKDVEGLNKKISGLKNKGFQIEKVVLDEKNDSFESSLDKNLNEYALLIKKDLKEAIQIINKPSADSIIKSIKINVPASKKALEVMKQYGFHAVVLRDTRGFLDVDMKNLQQKTPTLSDSGLDGIQACILMNGQDSVMPNLGREIYGEFVKSIFEAVPTFIIERSARLGLRLEDYLEDSNALNHEIYNKLVHNKKMTDLNFNEIHKFLKELGVIDKNGTSANQLIESHKRELLLPEVAVLKKAIAHIDDNEEEYQVYEFCVLEVFESLLKALAEFRELLNKIIGFFDQQNQLKAVHESFFDTFYTKFYPTVVKEYEEYQVHMYQLVRPVTGGYSKTRLLDDMAHSALLGNMGGITTRSNEGYSYGATGVFAATAWNALNLLIAGFDRYPLMTKTVRKFIDSEDDKIFKLYLLEIQQCLRYVLQNYFTDIFAHFGNYPIIDRYIAENAILKMRKRWNEEYSKKYGDSAIDTVCFTKIKEFLEQNLPQIEWQSWDYIRFSQLYLSFSFVIQEFFGEVSKTPVQVRKENIESR